MVVPTSLLHAQDAGNHIDVLDVASGELILDLHSYLWNAAQEAV
jgi:hypothetical protein